MTTTNTTKTPTAYAVMYSVDGCAPAEWTAFRTLARAEAECRIIMYQFPGTVAWTEPRYA